MALLDKDRRPRPGWVRGPHEWHMSAQTRPDDSLSSMIMIICENYDWGRFMDNWEVCNLVIVRGIRRPLGPSSLTSDL